MFNAYILYIINAILKLYFIFIILVLFITTNLDLKSLNQYI